MRAAQLHSGDVRAVRTPPPASTRELDADAGPVADGGRAAALLEIVPESLPPAGDAHASAPAQHSTLSRRRAAAPGLIGQPAAQAIEQLRIVGLTPAVELHETQVDAELGVVLAQDPPARVELARGATLALWVGAPPREAPPAYGEPQPIEREPRPLVAVLANESCSSSSDDRELATAGAEAAPERPVDDEWFVAQADDHADAERPTSAIALAPVRPEETPDARTAAHEPRAAHAAPADFDDGWFYPQVDEPEGNAGLEPTPDEPTSEPIAEALQAAGGGTRRGSGQARSRLRLVSVCLGLSVVGVLALAALASGPRDSRPSPAPATTPTADVLMRPQRPAPARDGSRRPQSANSSHAVAARRHVRQAPSPPTSAPTPPVAPTTSAASAAPPTTPQPAGGAQASAQPAPPAAESAARREFFAP